MKKIDLNENDDQIKTTWNIKGQESKWIEI